MLYVLLEVHKHGGEHPASYIGAGPSRETTLASKMAKSIAPLLMTPFRDYERF